MAQSARRILRLMEHSGPLDELRPTQFSDPVDLLRRSTAG